MKTEEIALSRVSENEANPRTITEANFQKLVKSILVFPKMLQLRPIVVDETYKALGGNENEGTLPHREHDTRSHHGRSRHRPAADRCREAGNRQLLEPVEGAANCNDRQGIRPHGRTEERIHHQG